MRITVVSRSWPSNERSGVSLASACHVRTLAGLGHQVSIVGSFSDILTEDLPVISKHHVSSKGSGSLYSPCRIDSRALRSALVQSSPELVIVEGWQTALTDNAVKAASAMKLDILMISHGSSVHPFQPTLFNLLRSFGWIHYKLFILPKLVKRLSALTTFDLCSDSKRFFDRDLALKLKIPLIRIGNSPVNWGLSYIVNNRRVNQILVVGYFTYVKNQMGVLKLVSCLPKHIKVLFVGKKCGKYYEKCLSYAYALGIQDRVLFKSDDECSLSYEISNSKLVLSMSVTEVLPITLIEAMACGTPFVSTAVGAVPSLVGGISTESLETMIKAIISLFEIPDQWQYYSDAGRLQHSKQFSKSATDKQIVDAVHLAKNSDSIIEKCLPTVYDHAKFKEVSGIINIATIISVYRKDDPILLSNAIDSIVNQGLPKQINHRIYIAIDGPVSDNLIGIIDKSKSFFYKVVYIPSNGGLAAALNELISVLEDEEFVFRMDSDDFSYPSRYLKQLEFMLSNSGVDILGGDIDEFDVASNRMRRVRFARDHREAIKSLAFRVPLAHPTVCMRRRVLDVVKSYPLTGSNEDVAMWFKCAKSGLVFANIHEPLLRYTVNANFWKRRGYQKAFSEFKCYMVGIWEMDKVTWKYVFPVARLILRLMPSVVSKFFYNSPIRGY